MKVVCIGDSITAGQFQDVAWPSLLTGHDVHNAGVSNDTTRLGLERFPTDVQERKPDAVVIQFGLNDCNRWETDNGLPRVSLRAWEANLIEMVERCRVFDARPFLCTITPSHKSKQHAAAVVSYDSALRDVANLMDVPIVDVRAAFRDHDGLLMDDGVHLTVAGHEQFASVVQEELG